MNLSSPKIMKSELLTTHTILYDTAGQKDYVQNTNEEDINCVSRWLCLMPPNLGCISNPFSVHMYGFHRSFL